VITRKTKRGKKSCVDLQKRKGCDNPGKRKKKKKTVRHATEGKKTKTCKKAANRFATPKKGQTKVVFLGKLARVEGYRGGGQWTEVGRKSVVGRGRKKKSLGGYGDGRGGKTERLLLGSCHERKVKKKSQMQCTCSSHGPLKRRS